MHHLLRGSLLLVLSLFLLSPVFAQQQDTTYTTLQRAGSFVLYKGLLWGITDKMVFTIAPETEAITIYPVTHLGLPLREVQFLSRIVVDDKDRLWVKEEYKPWYPLVSEELGYARPTDSVPSLKNEEYIEEYRALVSPRFVLSMLPMSETQAWIGTREGLHLVDREKKAILRSYLPEQHIRAICRDPFGTVWFAGGFKGLFKMGEDGPEAFPLAVNSDTDFVSWVVPDASGYLWVNQGGILKVSPASGEVKRIGTNSGIYHNQARWMHVAGDTVWAGATNSEGIAFFAGDTWHNFPATETPAMQKRVYEMTWDHKGTAWISGYSEEGSYHPELVQFNPRATQGEQWQRYRPRRGPFGSEDVLTNMTVDHEGRVWFLRKQDLYYYLPAQDTVMEAQLPKGFAPYKAPILVDAAGALWISSGSVDNYAGFGLYNSEVLPTGVMRIAGSDTTLFHRAGANEYNDYFTELFLGADDKVYGLAHDELYRFDGTQFSLLFGLGSGVHVTAIGADPMGNVWVGTYEDGLYYAENGVLEPFKPESTVIPNAQITGIGFDPQGNLWVSSYEGMSYINNPLLGE